MPQPHIPWPPKPIPDGLLILVGKVITSFNMLEMVLDSIIFLALRKEDFIFFRILTTRSNRAQILGDLSDSRSRMAFDDQQIQDWKRRFHSISDRRHRYAHSILTPRVDSDRSREVRRVKHRGPLEIDIAAQVPPEEELEQLVADIESLSKDLTDALNALPTLPI